MLTHCLDKLLKREDLSSDEMNMALDTMLENDDATQTAAFLALLQAKGPSVDEIVGLVTALRSKMKTVDVTMSVLDIVGTGGDKSNTVNISTGAALLAASCGVFIAKHGNRAVTSQCGSADFLEQLGIPIELDTEDVAFCIEQYGFAFCFAPLYHSAFQVLKEIRRALAIRTVFNQLGPLLNPANADYLMMGVNGEETLNLMSQVVLKLPVKRAIVYTGCQTDEITLLGRTSMMEINQGKIQSYELDPIEYGFNLCERKDLQGSDPTYNTRVLRDALNGQSDPVADTLILNAGIANYLYGIADSIESGVELANTAHKEGRAIKLINKLTAFRQIQRKGAT